MFSTCPRENTLAYEEYQSFYKTDLKAFKGVHACKLINNTNMRPTNIMNVCFAPDSNICQSAYNGDSSD
jgi:hypothetical protein